MIGGIDYDPAIRVIRDLFAWVLDLAARDLKRSPESQPPEMSAACRPLAPTKPLAPAAPTKPLAPATPIGSDYFAWAFEVAAGDLERWPESLPPERPAACPPLAPTTPPQFDRFASVFELAARDLKRSPENQPPEMSVACRALKLAARDLKRSLESLPEMLATCGPLAPTTPPRSERADVCERCGQPAPRFPIAA